MTSKDLAGPAKFIPYIKLSKHLNASRDIFSVIKILESIIILFYRATRP